MKRVLLLTLILAVTLIGAAYSQDDVAAQTAQAAATVLASTTGEGADAVNFNINQPLLNYFDSQIFHWDYNAWTGLQLSFQNTSTGGYFGLKPGMIQALSQYKDSLSSYNAYSTKIAFSNIFFWGGLGTMMGGAVSFAWTYKTGGANLWTSVGIAGGGLLLGLIGVCMQPSALTNLYDSINAYNRHKIAEYNQTN
jgi:hypothetical protein